MTTFLCPSSHNAVCPDYYHIIEDPEKIASFDFSTAVLDKLVASIDSYKGGETSVLGGNMLTLAIIHFEFLDTDIMEASSKWPRISLWTSEVIAEYEKMDCISTEKLLYGRLPTKNVSQTPFTRCNSLDKFPLSSSCDELLQFLLSVTPKENQKRVMDDFPAMMDNLNREMVQSFQPVITKNIISLLKCMSSPLGSATSSTSNIRKIDACQELATELSGKHNASDLLMKAQPFNPETQSVVKHDRVPRFQCTEGEKQSIQADVDEEKRPRAVSLNYPFRYLSDQPSLPEFFLFEEPSDKVLARWDEEACASIGIPSIQDIVKSLSSFYLSSELDIPQYPHLLEAMIPQKVELQNYDFETPSSIDLLSYMLEDKVYWEKQKNDAQEHHFKSWRTKDLFEGFDIPSSSGRTNIQNKRSTYSSLSDMSENCIALTKRPRMLEMKSELVQDMDYQVETEDNSKDVNLTPNTPAHSNSCLGNNDFPWDNPELVAELLDSTDRIEEEYYSQKKKSQFVTPERERVHIAEISPDKFVSTFFSTPFEKEVFIDIIARVPPTTKQKTIKIVQMGTTWAEHRVFSLSMQVYGKVIKYVINMMGKAVIVEQVEKKGFGLLPAGYWSKYFMEWDIAALFQKSFENPGKLCMYLRNNMVGFMLDTIDMVHMPLMTSGFWYLIVANFRKRMFEVLSPNNKIHLIADEANHTINNFKGAFNLAYKHSKIRVCEMPTTFRSVCSSNKEADSGIFIMKLIQNHDGDKTLCFEPEHAKTLRESLTYYMLAHPYNERMPPETKAILQKYGIAYDYTTPGYSPWGQQLHDGR